MDIHEAVGNTMKVTEEEMVRASEPMVEEPMGYAPEEGAGPAERPLA